MKSLSICFRKKVGLTSLAILLALTSVGPVNATDFFTRWIQRKLDRPVGPGFKPSNVYRSASTLPADVRRVALLPMSTAHRDSAYASGLDSLEPILSRELGKRGNFEVVKVSPEFLRRWAGKTAVKAEDPLPADLLNRIRETYACQAVIFAQLTQFQAFAPVQIGWNLRMVDSQHAETFWAADEVFDAGVPAVANAARRFAQDHQQEALGVTDGTLMLSSPRGFGQYTLHALFATLPTR